jgi:choline dehydrogenase-like flavoprotein
MTSAAHFDVIIIGTGAGGGTLARHLAPSGRRILLLERGPFLRRERENWDSTAVFAEGRYKTKETWTDGAGRPLHPGTHYCVGGNTKVYGAALFRLREEDFGALAHAGGVSPEWPIDYADLEPYYTEAEHLYEVRGERGVDPTEPWASGPYPYPAVQHEPRIQELHDQLARAGLEPFHVPLGVRLDERALAGAPTPGPESACVRCATCDGFPCLVNAKADAHVTCVQPALREGNVTLLIDALVTRLETSASGREVTRVCVERGGARETYSADLVVVSAGAVNSAALLLRSASDRHPHGLANSSGQVGRNYMCHLNSAMLALSRRPNPTIFQKTIAFNDFYFGAPGCDHPLGHVSMIGKSDAIVLGEGAPPFAPRLVLEAMARRSLDFWLTSEDLPDPDNRVTLDGRGGIVLSYRPRNAEAHVRLLSTVKALLRRLGEGRDKLLPSACFLTQRIPLAGVAHQCGTVRFGADPRTSALDLNCRAHDVDNLYVVDASFFPSSAAVNPALTIMANALRVGDHLLERLDVPSERRNRYVREPERVRPLPVLSR